MRPSRRQPDELRSISLERGVVKYAEGSCFVKFGDTHVLVTATLEDRLPPWTGELELLDAESGSQVKLQIDDRAREKYTAEFDRYAEVLEKIAASNGGRYVGVSTAMAIEDVIFGALVRAKGVV